MKKRLKVGIIGLGMGRHHLEQIVENPNADAAAICDVDPEILAEMKQKYNVPLTFTDAETMYEKAKLDGVIIATPNKFHAPLAISAFKKKLHVLCEKPMATNTAEALQMQAAAEQAGKKLMINMSYRFTPAALALKHQVTQGTLGEIYFGRTVWHRRRGIPGFGGWFSTKALSGGGPLIDLGVHRIDLALWLMGNPRVKTVSAATFDLLGQNLAKQAGKTYDVEDLAVALIRLENGAILNVEISWAIHRKEKEHMRTQLYGTLGGAVHENVDESYRFISKVYTEEGGFFVDKIFHDEPQQFNSSINHFIDCILQDKEPLATGLDGIRLMQILDGIYKSAELKREIEV